LLKQWQRAADFLLSGFEKVPAEVFGCFVPGELRIILLPGVGFANGGAFRDVPVEVIPFELRMPNTRLSVELDEDLSGRFVRVWRRDENE